LLWSRQYRLALIVLFAAGMTDIFDGLAARMLRTSSRFGEVWDPIADKCLMGTTFLTLTFTGAIEPWLVVIVIGRDLGILLAGGVAWLGGQQARRFPPSVWGKLSTFFQIAFVMFRMGHLADIVRSTPADVLRWVVAALAVWSAVDYSIRYFKGVQEA
jgi:CDP-diacylglycerol--glycerol-3-phosphate 3-phosphatidyltransferase